MRHSNGIVQSHPYNLKHLAISTDYQTTLTRHISQPAATVTDVVVDGRSVGSGDAALVFVVPVDEGKEPRNKT